MTQFFPFTIIHRRPSFTETGSGQYPERGFPPTPLFPNPTEIYWWLLWRQECSSPPPLITPSSHSLRCRNLHGECHEVFKDFTSFFESTLRFFWSPGLPARPRPPRPPPRRHLSGPADPRLSLLSRWRGVPGKNYKIITLMVPEVRLRFLDTPPAWGFRIPLEGVQPASSWETCTSS